ncbi:MAG: hypothetical protein O2877_03140 [bacterium]|nr:hypothetical protein [bacterium]
MTGALILLSTIMIVGTIIYYVAFLPDELWVLFVLLSPIAIWLLTPHHPPFFLKDLFHEHKHKLNRSSLFLVIVSVLLFVGLFSILRDVAILDAVRSPWERVPIVYIWLFILLFTTITGMAIRGKERALTLPIIATTLFTFIGMAAFVFPHGFGFDSFLHLATQFHIAEFETIDPKPLYYIGQYVTTLFVSQGFQIPLALVDRFLLIILVSIFLPVAWFFAASSIANNKRAAIFSTLGLFLLPLSGFIVTTPQGMANLFTLLLIIFSLPYLATRSGLKLGPLAFIALAAAVIHPLAGIPALLYWLLIALKTNNWHKASRRQTHGLFGLVAILGSISLPAVFVANSLISGTDLSFNLKALAPTSLIESLNFDLILQSGFNTFLDFTYIFGANSFLLLIVVTTVVLLSKKHKLKGDLWIPALMAFILLLNYIVMSSAVEFSFLIDYERGNYSNRLITLMYFFLAPYLAIFFMRVHDKTQDKGLLPKVFVGAVLVGLLTSQLYLTYPRRDNYETSHGFNTGTADILATEYIEKNAPEDFIVLANQQVSAAAVQKFGFKKYYGDIFYYPIPTGGDLYKSFLQMSERPTREIMEEAMLLAGVNTSYFIVNDYWWQAPRLIETAKINADDWIAIDDGRVHVFRYNHINLQ